MFCAILISVGVFFYCFVFFFFSEKGLHGQIHWEMLHTVVSSRKFTTHVRIVKILRNLMVKECLNLFNPAFHNLSFFLKSPFHIIPINISLVQ